jgi:hypothetical protein
VRFEVSAVSLLKINVIWGYKGCDGNGEDTMNLLGCDAVLIGRPIHGDFVSFNKDVNC